MTARTVRSLLFSSMFLSAAIPVAAQPVARGLVLDSHRRPLAGARVEFRPVLDIYEQGSRRLEGRHPEPVASASTDSLGSFSLSPGGPGVFAVRIAAPGRVPIEFEPLLLVADTELPAAVLPDDAGAHFVLKTAQGRAAAGHWVLAESAGEEPILGGWQISPRIGRTAPDGKVTLPRLQGEQLRVRSFTDEGTEDLFQTAVGGELTIGSTPANRRILKVVNQGGQPVAGLLTCIGEAAWPIGHTDSEGRILLHARAGAPFRVRLAGADGRNTVVHLPPSTATGSTDEETTVLAEKVLMSGRVLRDEDGKPLSGALVWSVADPGAFEITDAEGRYRTPVPRWGVGGLEVRAPGRIPRHISLDPRRLGIGRAPNVALAKAGGLAGRVVDSAGFAVVGAWIQAFPKGRDGVPIAPDRTSNIASGSTRADGGFQIGDLKPGEPYFLQVEKAGFLLTAFETLTPAFGHRGKTPVVLVLEPARAAAGRILDDKRRPIAGAEVRLSPARNGGRFDGRAFGATDPLDAVSDATGRFTVVEIPSLEINVAVAKAGFSPTTLRNLRTGRENGPINLGDITLRPGVALAGSVVDRRGKPIAGARIFRVMELRPPHELLKGLHDRPPQATTGTDGKFRLADLRRGEPLHLLVASEGFLPSTVRGVLPPLTVPLRIRLDHGSKLTGRVEDPEGKPVAGAAVVLSSRATLPGRDEIQVGPPVTRTTSADRDGRFHFTDMPAGKARLAVSAAGFQAVEEVPTALPQAPGDEVKLVLERGSTLEGRASTTAGTPVAGVRVLAGLANGISDDAGSFRIDGVPHGATLIEALHPRYKRFRRRVQIEDGTNDLDIVFEAGSTVRGRVVNSVGAPVPGAIALLETAERSDVLSYRTRSGANGEFSLEDVAAGRYRLRASARGYVETESQQVVLVGKESVDGLEVALEESGTIKGRILGLPSDELSVVSVVAVHESGASRTAELDAAGNYAVRSAKSGAWTIEASLLEGRRTARVRVLLPLGGEEARDLRFGGGITLAGRIVYRNEPLTDAKVSIRGQQLSVERSLSTSYDGTFRFQDLEADSYWLGVSQMMEQVAHNEIVLLEKDREVLIDLKRQTVAGRVTGSSDGKAVADAIVALRHIPGPEGPEFLIADSSDSVGGFAVERVPPGGYRMTVSHEGYAPKELELEVVAGQDLASVEIQLQPAQGTEITVRRASGGVPNLLHLRVVSPGGATLLAESRQVASSGKVRLSTVPAGTWTLLAAGSKSALTEASLSVPGERLDLILPDAAQLFVRLPALATSDSIALLNVLDSRGQPLQNLGLGGALVQQWPLVAGLAAIEAVPAGSWILSAKAPDGRIWTASVATDGRVDVTVNLE